MSFFPTVLQFRTAAAVLRNDPPTPAASAACDTNVKLVEAVAPPNEPNIGRYSTGCGVGMDALASPITLQAMKPPLRMISGFTPNIDGFHSTKSASFPGSIDPTSCEIPCVIAGLIVYFAT